MIRTRFAPSPTGLLHVGNARTAIVNYLLATKEQGKFILRIDDTDLVRSKVEYVEAIKEDLKWLGLEWDEIYWQSKKLNIYDQAKLKLIENNRLYECYETPDELELKRKFQLSSGKPPLYDRAGLKLTAEQKQKFIDQGRKPHYRFLLDDKPIIWQDLVKGKIQYDPANLSDPIVIREDGTMTYMICSTIDDIDYNITHVLRGEDHVSNTAIQIQMFEAFKAKIPNFGHLSLVKTKDEKISKRVGGFEISSLKAQGLEPMAICSFFASIGTSGQVTAYKKISELASNFTISAFSESPTTYQYEDLERLNHKLLISYSYNEIKQRLDEFGGNNISEEFWEAVKPNLKLLPETLIWWNICYNFKCETEFSSEDKIFLTNAKKIFPEGEINSESWKIWTELLAKETGRKGKNLFMPLRLAITSKENGPELSHLLPIIGRNEIINRLSAASE